MLIAICDDDQSWCEFASNIIKKYMEKIGQQIELLTFWSGQQLLDYEGETIDIVFLDIELEEEKNGILLAKEMNQKYPTCQIVYVTNYLFYAVDIFQTEPTYFVLKEQLEMRLPEIVEKVIHKLEQHSKKLVFSAAWGKQIIVQPSDIYYLERELRYTIVYTTWGNFQIKEKLDSLIKRLPKPDFSRCHHSYIVYFPAVREKGRNSFLLVNGKEIMISRGYLKQTNQDWMRWVLLQMS